MNNIYDVIILGAGPAGLAAGLYAGRSCLKTLLIEKGQDGGQIVLTNDIENYPGQLLEGETGASLVERMAAQAEKFGVSRCADDIRTVELEGQVKKLVGRKGEYLGKTVILATGAGPRPIGCKNEEQFVGRGISYCATCDANFFEDFQVYVVGGGDSAVEEAIHLSKFARRVTIIHRRDALRAARSIQEQAMRNPKIDFLWNSVVEEVDGDDVLNKMIIRNTVTGQQTVLEADRNDGLFGLFGFIGRLPNTGMFQGILEMDHGYIITDDAMRANIPGVYAAGDVRVKSLRQVVTAVSDGAIAAVQCEKYLSEMQ